LGAPEDLSPVSAAPVIGSDPSASPTRALLVEDNASERWLYTEILRTRGLHVTTCADGDRGWEAFSSEQYSLVILDLTLPGALDGLGLCARIRASESAPRAVILVITGRSDPETLEQVMDVGADDYLTKPIDAKLLNIRLAVAEREIRSRREKEHTREELEHATLELRRLFENLNDVFFSVDLREGHVIQISPGAGRLLGVPAEDLLRGTADWEPTLFPGGLLDRLRSSALSDPGETLVESFSRPDGTGGVRQIEGRYRPRISGGELARIDGTLADVTERHEAQAAVAQQNQEIQVLARIAELTLVDADPESVFSAILTEIAEATEYPAALLTRSDGEGTDFRVLASTGTEGVSGELRIPGYGSLSAEAVRSGRPVIEGDLRGRRGEGVEPLHDLGFGSALVVPLPTAGTLSATLVLGRADHATPDSQLVRLAQGAARTLAAQLERVDANRALQERERSAQALARALKQANAELEAFTYTVSHDLRAPLRTMQGFAHTMLQEHEADLPPEALDYMNRIVASGERAEQLISDLLRYSRLSFEAIELKPVDLNEVVGEVRDQLAADISASKASVKVEGRLPVVQGQSTILAQAIANLITNALKFVPEDRTPVVRIRPREGAGFTGVEVSDNGIGIPQDKIERVFRVFERLTDAGTREGTGIGLAIVRRAMERLGGSVGVESVVGEGSTFWLALPRQP